MSQRIPHEPNWIWQPHAVSVTPCNARRFNHPMQSETPHAVEISQWRKRNPMIEAQPHDRNSFFTPIKRGMGCKKKYQKVSGSEWRVLKGVESCRLWPLNIHGLHNRVENSWVEIQGQQKAKKGKKFSNREGGKKRQKAMGFEHQSVRKRQIA